MAKADFMSYGNKQCEFMEVKPGKLPAFNDKSGGDVDPYGDMEKKEAAAIDMNAGEAFNKKFYTEVDADGTDYPKKNTKGQMSDNKGDHFKVGEVDPMGDYAGKSQSGQSKRPN